MKKTTRQLVLSGLFLALGLIMPFLTMQIPELGSKLLPMHLPVLLCGMICGWRSGLLVGIMTPLLRSLLFGMPPMYPVAIAMAFELATYGLFAGYLYEKIKQQWLKVWLPLVMAMIFGRLVWGAAMYFLLNLNDGMFTLKMFLAGAWINAIPGIVLQLILIPAIMMSLTQVMQYEQ